MIMVAPQPQMVYATVPAQRSYPPAVPPGVAPSEPAPAALEAKA